MTGREQYTPGPASGAQVRKDGEKWTLILVRQLNAEYAKQFGIEAPNWPPKGAHA
jgi:hypothetical protein